MTLTSKQKQYTHSALLALVGALTDAGIQLASGSFTWTRTTAAGVLVGIMARICGAILAKMDTTDAN